MTIKGDPEAEKIIEIFKSCLSCDRKYPCRTPAAQCCHCGVTKKQQEKLLIEHLREKNYPDKDITYWLTEFRRFL